MRRRFFGGGPRKSPPRHKAMGCKTSREPGISELRTLYVQRRAPPAHITLTPCPRDACGQTRYALNIPRDFDFHREHQSGSDRWEKRLSAVCTSCRAFRIVFVVWRPCAECREGSAGPAALSALCGSTPTGTFACLSCGAYHEVEDAAGRTPGDDRT